MDIKLTKLLLLDVQLNSVYLVWMVVFEMEGLRQLQTIYPVPEGFTGSASSPTIFALPPINLLVPPKQFPSPTFPSQH